MCVPWSATSVVTVACGSSKKAATTPTTLSVQASTVTSLAASTTTTTSNAQTSTTAAASGSLTGTWSGQYSGSNSGTFTLTWQQTGSDLSGTINISEVGSPLPINGTVAGNSIHFGTVGAGAVTYTGAVSGSTMSGTWQDKAGNGIWKATKS